MTLPVYAINLDRSRSRWSALCESAAREGIELSRIAAVDGKAVAQADRRDLSESEFRRFCGRLVRPGEYGCYQSHLKALETFLESGAGAAVIVEDDVEFGANFLARAQALLDADPAAGVIKLLNHRIKGFRRHEVSRLGDEIGRCLHGPQGSAACYLVTAAGAAGLVRALRPMTLPYDVALERGWATGVRTQTVGRDLATLGPLREETEIATRSEYRQTRLAPLRRIPTHLFRARDYARRILYSFQC